IGLELSTYLMWKSGIMGVIKILLLLFCSVLIRNSSHALSVSQTDESDNEICACFKNTNQPVTETLGLGKNDLERLVIYLYHNMETGQIHVYTPNRDKQYSFPNLSYDLGDKLYTISPGVIFQLLNPSQNMESGLQYKPQESDPTVYGVNFNNVTNDQIIFETTSKYGPIDDIDVTKELFNPDEIDPSTKLPDENNDQVDPQYPESEILSTQAPSNLVEDLGNYVSPAYLQPDSNRITDAVKAIHIPAPIGDVASNLQKFNPLLGKYLLEKGSPFYQQHASIYTKPENIINNNYGVVDYGIASEIFPPLYKNVELHSYKNEKYLEPQQSSFNNPFGYNPVSFVDYSQPDKTIVKGNRFLTSAYRQSNLQGLFSTFDEWFDQQMRRINSNTKSSNKNIDLHSLKLLIEKTLYENQMYVTKDGVLIDMYGNLLNVANIKLLPILIGNAAPYNIILNVKNNRIELPTDVQFSEAILITIVYPPKILGVIKLGNAYVPKVSYRRRFNFWPTSINKDIYNYDNPIYVVRNAKHENNNHLKHDHDNNYVQPSKPRTVPGKLTFTAPIMSFISKANSPTVHKISLYEKEKPSIKANIKAKFDTISTLMNFQDDIKKDNKTQSFEYNQGTENNNQNVLKYFNNGNFGKENDVEDAADDNLPGIRIIGGAPATGSGTPVVSRGRSGEY
ncbi:hypothetical protein ACJJTC_010375, partial [Scirpophaga incertulas]